MVVVGAVVVFGFVVAVVGIVGEARVRVFVGGTFFVATNWGGRPGKGGERDTILRCVLASFLDASASL